VAAEVEVLKVLSVGVKVAVNTCLPVTGGFHKHVALLFGYEPEVTRSLQVLILLPPTKKRTLPATFIVTVIVSTTPL
jgi:hypothetical protein